MSRIEAHVVTLQKRFPLTISRGTTGASNNLFVRFEADGAVGWGEGAPGTGHGEDFAAQAVADLLKFADGELRADSPEEIAVVWRRAREVGLAAPTIAALDMALWDALARTRGEPLYRTLGLSPDQVPSSVTVGINPPDMVANRAAEVLERTGAKALKVKLGSPSGREHDRAIYEAAAGPARQHAAKLRVDANGGWTVDEAREMMRWLAERACDYVEQPLPRGAEADLPTLYIDRPLPIFADESCHFPEDVEDLAGMVDGVNVKLMKCGGITGAVALVRRARELGLSTMIGCMSESSLAISAGAAMGALFDHIDLDSNLNLVDEPTESEVRWTEGRWDLSRVRTGHGARPSVWPSKV